MSLAAAVFFRILSGNWKPQLQQKDFNPEECGYVNPLQHCIGGLTLMDYDGVLDKSSGEMIIRIIVIIFSVLGFVWGAVWLAYELLCFIRHQPIPDQRRQLILKLIHKVLPVIEVYTLVC